jgi:hypothetical protein
MAAFFIDGLSEIVNFIDGASEILPNWSDAA